MTFSFAAQAESQDTGKDWEIINPVNNDHVDILDTIGARIGRSIQGTELNYPTALKRDPDGKWWVANYFERFHRLTDTFEVDFSPTLYEVPSATNTGIRDCLDFALDTLADGTDVLIAPSYGRHCVRVYDRTTGDLISTIGVPGVLGNVADGRLRNPFSALLLSNGNVLVSCYNGAGPNGATLGTVSEWNISNDVAVLVRTVCEGGNSVIGSNLINRPSPMVFTDETKTEVWIVSYVQGFINRVNVETGNVTEIITSPTGADLTQSFGFDLMSDGNLLIASRLTDLIYIIDPVTKSLVSTIDPKLFGAASVDLRGVFEFDDGVIGFCDWTSQLLYLATVNPITVQYETPAIRDGWELDRSTLPAEMDDDFVMTVDAPSIGEKIVPMEFLTRKVT